MKKLYFEEINQIWPLIIAPKFQGYYGFGLDAAARQDLCFT